jgi:hypothetical protein
VDSGQGQSPDEWMNGKMDGKTGGGIGWDGLGELDIGACISISEP